MKKIYFVLLILLNLACQKSEFSINDDFEEVPVVYAILDASDSRHFIKVERGFLSSGSALENVNNIDSIYYNDDDIEELYITEKAGDEVINIYNLQQIQLSRDPYSEGDFSNTSIKAYYFDANLNQDFTYTFYAKIKGKEVTSSTEIVKSFSFLNNSSIVNFKPFATSFKDVEVKWQSSTNASRYDMALVFKYREFYNDGSYEDKEIRNYIDASSVGVSSFKYSGESVFRFISDNITDNPNVSKRAYYGFGYEVFAASKNLDLYLSIIELDGYNQEKPFFSNIDGGVGLFASKFSISNTDIYFQKDFTAPELMTGAYTGNLKFCFSEEKMSAVFPDSPDFVSFYNNLFCD